jgi:uncharacterized protein YkwD
VAAARRLALFLVSLLALTAFADAAAASPYDRYLAPKSACAHANDRSGSIPEQEQAMRCLINWTRQKAHLRNLARQPQLTAAADLKAGQLLRCQKFAHAPCSGKDAFSVFRSAGYGTSAIRWAGGENIAWGTSYLGSPRQVMRAWLNSSGHRHNILSPEWHDQGVALRTGRFLGYANVAVWVSHFGVRG